MRMPTGALTSRNLLRLWHRMDDRNRALGPARYDFGDVKSHPTVLKLSHRRFGRLLVKALQVPELLAPILWRKLLRVPKHIIPTVFYHLGLSYLAREQLGGDPAFGPDAAQQMCDQALARQLDAEHVCWEHPYGHHAAAWRDGTGEGSAPPSCAHHTGRVGRMLLCVGRAHGREDLIEAGISATRALLEYHQWHEHADGSCTMSYYPFSSDEVINTGADAAALLAALPPGRRTDAMRARLCGLVKMIAAEQQPDGSWVYCTRRHYQRWGGGRTVDNHHSAMNVAALAHVLRSGALPAELSDTARRSLADGCRYYLSAFYDDDGAGLYFPDGRRGAGVVGYSEGISAVAACLRRPSLLPEDLGARARDLLPRMLDHALTFLDRRTGDVACYRFLGRAYHIRSARWGSAPLMQAITDYLILDEATDDEPRT